MGGSDASPARRRDGRSTDTRDRVVEVALELFLQRGFSHTTLQDIADELGLTRAALYYHYRSKDDLIASLIQPAKEDVDRFLSETASTTPLRQIAETFFDLNYRHRRIFLALLRDPTGLSTIDAEGWVPELAAHGQRLFAGDDPTPDGRIRAVVALNGLSRCATMLTDIPHDELRQRSVDLALQIIHGGSDAS